MKIGDYIKQDGTEYVGLVVDKLKNGAYAVYRTNHVGRIVQSSTKGWYPEPHVIDKQTIPTSILLKINRYIEKRINAS